MFKGFLGLVDLKNEHGDVHGAAGNCRAAKYFEVYLVNPGQPHENVTHEPISGSEWESFGIKPEDLQAGFSKERLFIITSKRTLTTLGEIVLLEKDFYRVSGRKYARPGRGTWEVPFVWLYEEEIKKVVEAYYASPRSKHNSLQVYAERSREQGRTALLKVKDQILHLGSYNEAWYKDGEFRGVKVDEVAPLWKDGKPYNPITTLKGWPFKKRKKETKKIWEGYDHPEIGKIEVDTERPGIIHHQRASMLGLPRFVSVEQAYEAACENISRIATSSDPDTEVPRCPGWHLLLGQLTLDMPEGVILPCEEIDTILTQHAGIKELSMVVNFSATRVPGTLWFGEVISDQTSGLEDLRNSLMWRPRVSAPLRLQLTLRQVLRLSACVGWGVDGRGLASQFLREFIKQFVKIDK